MIKDDISEKEDVLLNKNSKCLFVIFSLMGAMAACILVTKAQLYKFVQSRKRETFSGKRLSVSGMAVSTVHI